MQPRYLHRNSETYFNPHKMIQKIALFGRHFSTEDLPYIEEFIKKCVHHNIKVLIHNSLEDILGHSYGLQYYTSFNEEGVKDIDFAVSIGGDGTFLRTARRINALAIPILGVNTGRLGFLAETGITELCTVLDELIKGDYSIGERTVLQISEKGKTKKHYALNDVTLIRRDTSSLIVTQVKANGMLLNNYWSDGIIIATPTGSTAYSMSAGGPIVLPQSNNITITPIAPHSLTVRSLVLPDDVELEISVESRNSNFMLTIDSSSNIVDTNRIINIKKADYKVKIIQRNNYDFFDTLRQKLLWGEDIRTGIQ